jgi:hypothetical protein
MGFETLREDEEPFFKENKIAVPARVTNFVNSGGKSQPTIDKNYISGDPGMGKQAEYRDPDLMTYVGPSVNVS